MPDKGYIVKKPTELPFQVECELEDMGKFDFQKRPWEIVAVKKTKKIDQL